MAPRFNTVILSAALLASNGACASVHPSLTEVPVANTQAVPPETYSEASARAAGGSAPVEIALGIVGDFEGSTQQIVQANEGSEAPRMSHLTVLRDGITDDSIRGERWDITLARAPAGVWSIREVKHSWRCRRGGNTDRFAAVPCP